MNGRKVHSENLILKGEANTTVHCKLPTPGK
jgi:hypothetical protein